MIPYILHVALLISICLLFYKIFLQRETFYRLNRIVLLICLCLSFALPLVTVPQAWTLRSEPDTQIKAEVQPATAIDAKIKAQVQQQILAAQKSIQTQQLVHNNLVVKAEPVTIKYEAVTPAKTQPTIIEQAKPFWPIVIKWLFYIYWAGAGAFGLNLLLQVIVLLYRAYSNPVIRDGRFRIIEVSGDKAPCSFGNNIFINPEKYDWDTYNQILMHEKVHIQQGHSLDILLAELVLVFQWFNPFAWLYRAELENNLEFLTDEEVLDHNCVEKESYQMSLLKVSVPHLALSVTTNYNQSLLKKRIVMMNAKRSNIHTMWKYFILVPLMGGLACALNQAAFSQTKKSPNTSTHNKVAHRNWDSVDRTQGTWFATIKGEKIRMEFRSDDDDRNWNSSDDFLLSEFSALPKDTKGDFTLKRDAGTMIFDGKFEGDEGYGHFKFTADRNFTAYLKSQGISDIEDNDQFAFFMINIKRGYVEMLKTNGYSHISKNDLISMAALKVDEPYIKFWKELGYDHLSTNDLVSGKALGVNKEYVQEIKNAGYRNLDFNQLISFKAQGIDGKYIATFRKANLNLDKGKDKDNDNGEHNLPRAEDISSYKAMNIDSSYISKLKEAGYKNIPFEELTSMKAVGVTPEYIKELASAGYKNIPANDLVSMKSVGVSPEYVNKLASAGYKNISANELVSMKSVGVSPEYVNELESAGYKNISANDLVSMKSVGVNPEYVKELASIGYKDLSANDLTSLKSVGVTIDFVKGFEDLGYKNISANELTSLKAVGVTPDYIKSFVDIGYKNIPANELTSLKSLGIKPAYVKGFEDLGYKDISLNDLSSVKALGVTPEYIKSFEAVGYKHISLNDLTSLKATGVTPAFIQGFKDIGYSVSLNEATSLKATGVTPAYVKEMREKGFVSKDLDKYIQLKSAFN